MVRELGLSTDAENALVDAMASTCLLSRETALSQPIWIFQKHSRTAYRRKMGEALFWELEAALAGRGIFFSGYDGGEGGNRTHRPREGPSA